MKNFSMNSLSWRLHPHCILACYQAPESESLEDVIQQAVTASVAGAALHSALLMFTVMQKPSIRQGLLPPRQRARTHDLGQPPQQKEPIDRTEEPGEADRAMRPPLTMLPERPGWLEGARLITFLDDRFTMFAESIETAHRLSFPPFRHGLDAP